MRALLIAFFLLFLTGYGFAQESRPFVQTGLNAVFAVGDDTTTAMYSFSYAEPSRGDLRWVLPLPSNALSIRLETSYLPVYTQSSTEPDLDPYYSGGTEYCDLSVQLVFGEGVWPQPSYYLPDSSDLTIMNTAEQVRSFLEVDDGVLSAVQQAALHQYAAQNYTFAALTVTPDPDIPEADGFWTGINLHLSPTVVVEYADIKPVLPLAFRAVSVAAHLDNYDHPGVLPVTAYIFADTPYTPNGTPAFQPDLTRIQGARNQLANTMRITSGDPIFFNQLDPEYYALFLEGIEANGGEALVAEFIDQAEEVNINHDRYSLEETSAMEAYNQLATSHLVLSRWRTFLTPDQAVNDLTFDADPSIAPFRVNFEAAVDGAWFFGCTSRKLYNPELESHLPEGRTYLDAVHLSIAHPEGWVLTTLYEEVLPVYVLSPNVVTYDELMTRRQQRPGPPMMLIRPIEQDGNQAETLEQYATGQLPREEEGNACAMQKFYLPSPNAIPWADVSPTEPLRSSYIAIYTNTEDCAANEFLYTDMVRYAASYQFFLSSRLRHTLFFGILDNLTAVGYPEGWIETLDANNERVILPEGAAYETSPAVYVLPRAGAQDVDTELQNHYGLGKVPIGEPTAFTAAGRQGYIVRSHNRSAPVIEFSAPISMFSENADLLQHMANSVWINEIDADS